MTCIRRSEGTRALYRGIVPSLVGMFPEAAITYGAYDALKDTYRRVTRGNDAPGVVPSLCCGIVAALTGQCVAFPAEVLSRRLAVGGKDTGNALAVARGIFRERGVRGFYVGIGAASARVVPMAFLSFGTYELVRRWIENTAKANDAGGEEGKHRRHLSRLKPKTHR